MLAAASIQIAPTATVLEADLTLVCVTSEKTGGFVLTLSGAVLSVSSASTGGA